MQSFAAVDAAQANSALCARANSGILPAAEVRETPGHHSVRSHHHVLRKFRPGASQGSGLDLFDHAAQGNKRGKRLEMSPETRMERSKTGTRMLFARMSTTFHDRECKSCRREQRHDRRSIPDYYMKRANAHLFRTPQLSYADPFTYCKH